MTASSAAARARRRTRDLRGGGPTGTAVPTAVRRALEAAAVEATDRELAVVAVAVTVGAVIVGSVAIGPLGVLVGPVGAAIGVAGGLFVLRHRSEAILARSVPDLIEAMARSLRSGASPSSALREATPSVAAPLRRDLEPTLTELARGVSFADALAGWRERRPIHPVRLAVAALTLGSAGGGDRARGLDGVAATLRDRQALDAETAASAAQAKASAVVLAVLPIAFGLVGIAADSDVVATLFGTPAGRVCLVVGVVLDVAGAVWMARIVASR